MLKILMGRYGWLRSSVVLCCAALLATVVGCGGSNSFGTTTTTTTTTPPPTSTSPAATTTTLTVSPATTTNGVAVTFTATVAPAAASGTVLFTVTNAAAGMTSSFGPIALNGGTASYTSSSLSVGNLTVSAAYSGATAYLASTSPSVALIISNAAPVTGPVTAASTTTSLLSNLGTAVQGTNVTFTAGVQPAAATGTVSFQIGSTVLGTGTLASGTATFATTQLPVGTDSVTAVYQGTTAYKTSTSTAVPVIVTAPPTSNPTPPVTYTGVAFSASVLAGTTPVSGATVTLYAAGNTGNGKGATLLETATTGSAGTVTMPATYNCPASSSLLYLVSSGGTVAPATAASSGLSLMTLVGACSTVTNSTSVTLNEVTTVADVYALAPFLALGGQLGSSATNFTGFANALATAAALADPVKGATPGATLPANVELTAASTSLPSPSPILRIQSLANAIHSCAATTASCTSLFAAATPSGGTAPTNTLDALFDIAQHPANNAAALYTLTQASNAYGPGLTVAPADWTLFFILTGGGMNAPSGLGIDSTGAAWVASYFSAASKFTPLGAPVFAFGLTGGGLDNSYGLAMDLQNDAWIPDEQGNGLPDAVTELNSAGNTLGGSTGFTAGGLSFPISTAVDPNGTVWVVDYGNSHLTLLNSAGTPISGASGYTTPLFAFPVAVVLDANHYGWVANQSSTTITKAAPDGSSFINANCCNGASGMAIDQADNVWVANYYGSNVSLVANSGAVIANGYTGGTSTPSSTGTQLNHPQGIAIDGAGNVWVANYRANYITELQGETGTPGTPISPSTGYGSDANLIEAYALALDASGNVWVTDFGTNTVTKFIGMAVPVKTPLSATPVAP